MPPNPANTWSSASRRWGRSIAILRRCADQEQGNPRSPRHDDGAIGETAEGETADIVALEQSEERGTIELATLRRVAEALGYRLVYALIPNKSLEAAIRDRAREFLDRRRRPVEHSMRLEDQRVDRNADALLDEIVRETNPRLFWD